MYILYVCALGICACTIAAATTTITVCIAIRLLHLSHALQHCGGGSKFKGKVMKENSDKIAKKENTMHNALVVFDLNFKAF